MQEPHHANRPSMLWLALLVYAPMLVGLFFLKTPGLLRIDDWRDAAWGLLASLVAGAAVILGSRFVARQTQWGRALYRVLWTVLHGLSSTEVMWLALLSAFGEEVLFRGVMHPRLGLWPAAVIFAAFHFPIRRELIPWTGFALVMGLGLGLLTDMAGNLWPAILTHFLINFFNLHDLADSDLDDIPETGAPPSEHGPP